MSNTKKKVQILLFYIEGNITQPVRKSREAVEYNKITHIFMNIEIFGFAGVLGVTIDHIIKFDTMDHNVRISARKCYKSY